MNYLAHIFLSGRNTPHAIGNFVADVVKGKEWEKYPEPIQNGIRLHRAIDQFTDKHPIFKSHASLLFDDYRHYSRVIVDMFYDHYLSKHWEQFHPQPLTDFIQTFHISLTEHFADLPLVIQKRLPILIKENWLLSYGSLDGLEGILRKMEKRTCFPSRLSSSITSLVEHNQEFESGFFEFFDALSRYCKTHSFGGDYKENPYFDSLKNSSK